MEDAVRALVRRHAFKRGSSPAASIAADFAVPLITYRQDGILLYRTRADVERALDDYFASLQSAGVDRVEPEVLEISPGGPDRVSALVDWRHVAADGSVLGVNRSRAFFRRLPGRATPVVELVEYISVSTRSIFGDLSPAARRLP